MDEEKDKNPNIINILTMVIQDIEEHGIEDKVFTRGVMSLIYKKKDKHPKGNKNSWQNRKTNSHSLCG